MNSSDKGSLDLEHRDSSAFMTEIETSSKINVGNVNSFQVCWFLFRIVENPLHKVDNGSVTDSYSVNV